MKIEDRMLRREPEDIVELGQIVEEFLKSPMYVILKALCNGSMSLEAQLSRDAKVPADRVLGRIEAYTRLLVDLEQFVSDKDSVIAKLNEAPDKEEVVGAEAPR